MPMRVKDQASSDANVANVAADTNTPELDYWPLCSFWRLGSGS